MSQVVIVGAGTALDDAWEVACECFNEPVKLPVLSPDDFNFDLAPLLSAYPPTQTRVFVAMDARAVNYVRHRLIAQVQLAGYELVSLVSPDATLDAGAKIARNVYIGPGSSVGPQCSLGPGSWLARRVVLDRGVSLGACVTLASAVVLGVQVRVGTGSTLSAGSVALAGCDVGKRCEWLLGATLPGRLPDYSFYDALMPEGARIYRN